MTKQTLTDKSLPGRRARHGGTDRLRRRPALAHKTPVTPQQLKAYDDAFMEEVKKGEPAVPRRRCHREENGRDVVYHWHGLRDVPSDDCRHPSAFISQISGTDGQVRKRCAT